MNSGHREGLYYRGRTEVLRWSRNNSESDGGKLLKVWPLNQSSGPKVSGNHKELPKTELPMSLTCEGKKKKKMIFGSLISKAVQMGASWSSSSRRVSELGGQKHVGWWEVSVFLTLALSSQVSSPQNPRSVCAQVTLERSLPSPPLSTMPCRVKAGFLDRKTPSWDGGGYWGEGTMQKGRGITDEAKLILETIKSLKRERVFSRDSESL